MRRRGFDLGRGLISSDPEAGRGEQDGGEEVPGQLVETGCDASEVLQLVEEAFDQIALTVEFGGDWALDHPGPLRRDMRSAADGSDQVEYGSGVIAAIGDEIAIWSEALDELGNGSMVGGVAGRQRDSQRQALAVDDRIDLGTQSSTRAAEGVIRAPFLPPAACW